MQIRAPATFGMLIATFFLAWLIPLELILSPGEKYFALHWRSLKSHTNRLFPKIGYRSEALSLGANWCASMSWL